MKAIIILLIIGILTTLAIKDQRDKNEEDNRVHVGASVHTGFQNAEGNLHIIEHPIIGPIEFRGGSFGPVNRELCPRVVSDTVWKFPSFRIESERHAPFPPFPGIGPVIAINGEPVDQILFHLCAHPLTEITIHAFNKDNMIIHEAHISGLHPNINNVIMYTHVGSSLDDLECNTTHKQTCIKHLVSEPIAKITIVPRLNFPVPIPRDNGTPIPDPGTTIVVYDPSFTKDPSCGAVCDNPPRIEPDVNLGKETETVISNPSFTKD